MFNQFTEPFSVLQLAEMIRDTYPGSVRIARIENPRVKLPSTTTTLSTPA